VCVCFVSRGRAISLSLSLSLSLTTHKTKTTRPKPIRKRKTHNSPTEITAFSDRYEEFKKINTEVLGVSVDSQFSHLAWIQTDRKEGAFRPFVFV